MHNNARKRKTIPTNSNEITSVTKPSLNFRVIIKHKASEKYHNTLQGLASHGRNNYSILLVLVAQGNLEYENM